MKSQNRHQVKIYLSGFFFILFFVISSQAQDNELYKMSIEELMNVKITSASKRIQKLIEAPATVYVITEDDIKQYGYRDLQDVLQNTPGIEYSEPHSNSQGGQRGFAGNWTQSRILINGRQVNVLFSSAMYIASQYTLNNVKQIEIIQGPASALYGADAFTGVINIITKDSDNTNNHSYFSVDLGSTDKIFDSKQISFTTIAEKKKLGMSLNGTLFSQKGPDFTDFIRSAEYAEVNRQLRNDMLDNDNPYRDDNRAYNANIDLIYSINDNNTIKAGAYLLRNQDGGGIEANFISYTNFDMHVEDICSYLIYEHKFSSSPVKLSMEAIHQDENIFIRSQSHIDEGDNPPFISAYNIEGSKLNKINVQFDVTPKNISNYLITGFGYSEKIIGESAFTGISTSDSTLGNPMVGRYIYPPTGYFANLRPYLDQNIKYAYLQDQHSFFNERVQVTIGGRFDHHNIYGNITSIRSGLYFQIIKGWVIKANYGEAFREPTIFDLSGNPKLKPSEMKTGELSLHFNPIKNITGQFVYYKSKASSIIEERCGTVDEGCIRVNIGVQETEGIENLIKYQFNKFKGNVWYNYERNPNDPDFINVAKHKLGLGVIYSFTKNISMSLQGKYTDKIKSDAWDADYNDIIITIPEYKSFNLTLLAQQISFSNFPEIDLSFSIYNLFDTKNLYPNLRGPIPSRYIAEGRSFYIGAGIHF